VAETSIAANMVFLIMTACYATSIVLRQRLFCCEDTPEQIGTE